MTERYVIGTSPVPNWCRDDLMPYIKADGSTGYEYQTPWNTLNLKCGDVLINKNGRVEVKFHEKI